MCLQLLQASNQWTLFITCLGIECKCLPETTKDRIYNEISTNISSVYLAECSCAAYKNPHGSCKHIAATLFALESFYATCQEAKDDISCISKLPVWNQSRKGNLILNLSFQVEEYYHKPCHSPKEFFGSTTCELQNTTNEEKAEFIKET